MPKSMQDFANSIIMQLIHNSYKQCPPFCFIHNIKSLALNLIVSFGLNDWIIQGVLSRQNVLLGTGKYRTQYTTRFIFIQTDTCVPSLNEDSQCHCTFLTDKLIRTK